MIYDYQENKVSAYLPLTDLKITSETKHTGSLSGVQSSFVTESGKVWMIKENGDCVVVQSGSVINTFTIDHSVGHANSANYDNGKAYISDWTTGTTIHVFTVDDVNSTMTYSKDLSVPTTYGRTEYFVFDNENQIYSLSWNVTHASDSAYMVLGLWKKDNTGTYVNAFETIVTGVEVAQGMCVKNGLMYIINNTSSYKHIGIMVVDLQSFEQYSEESQTGTILTLETEGITPLTDDTFLVCAYNGSQFLLTQTY